MTMDIAAIERACVARGWACTVERIGGSADGPISIRVEVPCYPVASTATLLWRGTHWRIHQVAANLADLLAILGALDQHGVR